jgi:hypothetical protein
MTFRQIQIHGLTQAKKFKVENQMAGASSRRRRRRMDPLPAHPTITP